MTSFPETRRDECALPRLGVIIVAYQSADVLADCLASLAASVGVEMAIVVVDNMSTDETCDVVRDFAHQQSEGASFVEADVGSAGATSPADLTLLRSPLNGGYAYGVNRGLELLLTDNSLDLFWVLNPDCMVEPDTAATFAQCGADGEFALMGGRTAYVEPAGIIQSDGGTISLLTGVCALLNVGEPLSTTPAPDAGRIDFISGANLVASRKFIQSAGLMREDYFLYYEEVDWALRRGSMPLRVEPAAIVRHHGGTAIGSSSPWRRASPFAIFLNYRSRVLFMCRFAPLSLPLVLAYALAKALQLYALGAPDESNALLRGAFGLAPPREVRRRLPPGFSP